jgi:opacity protein-like surface antigen
MRTFALAMALASTALAAPAVARDHTWYAGVEGGLIHIEDSKFDVSGDAISDRDDFLNLDYKTGLDLDIIGGYDFGLIRGEFEAGYKRASIDEVSFLNTGVASDSGGHVRAFSAMANALVDIGDENGLSGYFGGGLGLANVRYRLHFNEPGNVGNGSDSDRSFAYQAIVGVRHAVSDNIDVGVKYRYFVAPKLNFDIIDGEAKTRFRSHSLLASLVFNFAPPPPPPVVVEPVAPPPPPPPATQTCFDGSVILATDTCPQPPVETPPPPPEPTPERG